MKIYIKYMVSLRCKMKVKEQLRKLGLLYEEVDLGMVVLLKDLTVEQRSNLKNALLKSGLELMDDKKAIQIERVKNLITELVHESDELPAVKFSDYLSKKLDCSYFYLAKMFSEVKGMTIEQYIIANKIERVKELLLYDELNLSEISYKLKYSSVAHLSSQFKKVTGLTPTYFKQLRQFKKRISLEEL